MQWILLLIQMNASVADMHYVELYETLEECTADLQEISPRLEPHEAMLCVEANNRSNWKDRAMSDRRQIANELWMAFKHYDGERKFALRQIIRYLREGQDGDDTRSEGQEGGGPAA